MNDLKRYQADELHYTTEVYKREDVDKRIAELEHLVHMAYRRSDIRLNDAWLKRYQALRDDDEN